MKLRTIRQAAAEGPLNENRLREMRKAGILPGIMSGNRFLVDMDQLQEMLVRASKPANNGDCLRGSTDQGGEENATSESVS